MQSCTSNLFLVRSQVQFARTVLHTLYAPNCSLKVMLLAQSLLRSLLARPENIVVCPTVACLSSSSPKPRVSQNRECVTVTQSESAVDHSCPMARPNQKTRAAVARSESAYRSPVLRASHSVLPGQGVRLYLLHGRHEQKRMQVVLVEVHTSTIMHCKGWVTVNLFFCRCRWLDAGVVGGNSH